MFLKFFKRKSSKEKELEEKKDRKKWTNRFRELGKKKGSSSDFVNLYKEMKKNKDSKDKITKTENETKSWKDLIDTGEE